MNIAELYLWLFCFAILAACGNGVDHPPAVSCGPEVIISSELFSTAETELLDIIELNIIADCLVVTVGSSGCDGETWVVKLIDAGQVLESLPVQRNIVISISNEEECDAYFMRDYAFDISDLQIGDSGTILLNIFNSGDQISYEY